MFAGELKARAAKLEREQKERAERERQRKEKERILQERARQRQEEREQEARQRRLEQLAAEQADQERHQVELEHNRGVYLHTSLQAAPADEDAAIARGIKRVADKLVLPPSNGAQLMAQDAPKNGAMLFELAAPNGARTHAGVLEFTAPEGVVLLPKKVVNCLWGPSNDASPAADRQASAATASASGRDSSPASFSAPAARSQKRCSGRISVMYRRLEKGTYVRFQPELRRFHDEVGCDPDAMRLALEQALLQYCTLSEGDWIQVKHGDEVYNLRVLELQPAPAVSIIDTDIAADVGPSIETEGYLRAREEEIAREQERLRQLEEEREQLAAEALAAAEQARVEAEQAEAEEAAQRIRIRSEKEAGLPDEVPVGSTEPHVTCMFRLPDGSRVARRFRMTDPVQLLFDVVDSKGAGGLWPGTYMLVAQFPRRTYLPGSAAVLSDLPDFVPGQQQALFIEPIPNAAGGSQPQTPAQNMLSANTST
eukprot:jgi/Chrzof1/689/Cz01g24350.t1